MYDSSATVFNIYGVSGTPTFFIITKNDKIAARCAGGTPAATLAEILIDSPVEAKAEQIVASCPGSCCLRNGGPTVP